MSDVRHFQFDVENQESRMSYGLFWRGNGWNGEYVCILLWIYILFLIVFTYISFMCECLSVPSTPTNSLQFKPLHYRFYLNKLNHKKLIIFLLIVIIIIFISDTCFSQFSTSSSSTSFRFSYLVNDLQCGRYVLQPRQEPRMAVSSSASPSWFRISSFIVGKYLFA